MASGAELPTTDAPMYRHWAMKASGSGSKGLWVERGVWKNMYLSSGMEEYTEHTVCARYVK